jgi:hypothetical protein
VFENCSAVCGFALDNLGPGSCRGPGWNRFLGLRHAHR